MTTLNTATIEYLKTAWQLPQGPLAASLDKIAQKDKLAAELYLAAASDDQFTVEERISLKANGIDDSLCTDGQWSRWYALYSSEPQKIASDPDEIKYKSTLDGIHNRTTSTRLAAVAFIDPETINSSLIGHALLDLIFNDTDPDIQSVALNRLAGFKNPETEIWLRTIMVLHTNDEIVSSASNFLEQKHFLSLQTQDTPAPTYPKLSQTPMPDSENAKRNMGFACLGIGLTLTGLTLWSAYDANGKMIDAAENGDIEALKSYNRDRNWSLGAASLGGVFFLTGTGLAISGSF